MDGQLVQVCSPTGSSSELTILVRTLRQEFAELRDEVQRLQRENLEEGSGTESSESVPDPFVLCDPWTA